MCFLITTSIGAQIDRSVIPLPGPAPQIKLGEVKTFSLDNGLKVLVVENNKLPRAYASLVLDNYPDFEGKIKGVSSLTSSLMGNGTQSISKDDFNEEIDFMGARLGLNTNGGQVSSLIQFFPRMLELLAESLVNPLLDKNEFFKEKEKLLETIKSNKKNVQVMANRIVTQLWKNIHLENFYENRF